MDYGSNCKVRVYLLSSARRLIFLIDSIATHDSAKLNSLRNQWVQVWELASRTLATPSTSRAACNLMSVILKYELVAYTDIADTIESIVSSVDLNGPSVLTDSGLLFWSLLMKLRTKANPNLGLGTAKQICGWLKGTWTLGMCFTSSFNLHLILFSRKVS